MKIIISPDQFTEDECSWELKRLGDEDALLSSLPCRSKTLCASPGDYSLTVRDIDGFTPGFGYSVEVEGRRLAAGSSFNVEESKVFSVGSAEAV